MTLTPIPNRLNDISCRRVDGKLITLAEEEMIMTWRMLLDILKGMEKVNHTAMDKDVLFLGDDRVYVDISESLITADVVLLPHFISLENEDGE